MERVADIKIILIFLELIWFGNSVVLDLLIFFFLGIVHLYILNCDLCVNFHFCMILCVCVQFLSDFDIEVLLLKGVEFWSLY